ncbi:MAG: RluA family pseudouridine synthase [Bacteroidota bacterium]
MNLPAAFSPEEQEPDYEDFTNLAEEEDEAELFEHYRFTVDPGQTMLRIDRFLMDRMPNATRNKIQAGIEAGSILVNKEVTKNSYKVKPGDVITLSLPKPLRDTTIVPQDIPLDIVFEDDTVLVVNKPAGMVVHPAQGNWDGTLVNALVWHLQNLPTSANGEARPGLVHRIDKDTSGLLVIAKTEPAMQSLGKQFFVHSIERTYQALVWGDPAEDSGTIDVNVGRSLKDRRVTAAFPDGDFGRNAITHWKVLKRMGYVTLLQCNLETGRTHQIRAHMKYLGHPLFNDAMYGGNKILKGTNFSKYKQFVENCFALCPRQALHAETLGFVHPATGETIRFTAPLPNDMQAVLNKWEKYTN